MVAPFKIQILALVLSVIFGFSLNALQLQTTSPQQVTLNKKVSNTYDYAGVLPVVTQQAKTYVVLEKIPTVKKIDVYGDIGGKKADNDFDTPQATAARHFSKRTDTNYNKALSLIDNKIPLYSEKHRYNVFPVKVTEDAFDDLKFPYIFIPLENIKKAIEFATKNNKFRDIEVMAATTSKGEKPKVVILREELVKALVENNRNKNNNFFKS